MQDFKIPNGLSELGFDRRDVDKLAERATASLKKGAIAPRDPDSNLKIFKQNNSLNVSADALADIYEKSLKCY